MEAILKGKREQRISNRLARQLGWLVILFSLVFLVANPGWSKQFTDSLATDFQGGVDDNIQINQNLIGGLQLAPYSMLGSWSTSSSLTNPLYLAAAVVHNGRVYLSGGKGSADSTSTDVANDSALAAIHFGTLQSDGTIGKWDPNALAPLPQPTYGHAMLVLNSRMYIIGGRSVTSSTLDAVYWARISGWDGEIRALYQPNTWTAAAPLPMPLYRPAAVQFEGKIYVLGGQNNSDMVQNTVYYTSPRPNGDILPGSWQTTAPLPIPLTGHNALVNNGRIYVLGGSTNGLANGAQNQIFVGTINPLTGNIPAWTATTPLPIPLTDASAVIAGGKIWVCGGTTSGTATAVNTIYYATLEPITGLIPAPGPGVSDSWTRGTDLPAPVKWHNLVALTGHLAVIGGMNSTGSQKQTYISTLIPNKQNIATWTPTTSLFVSPYGGGMRDIWFGHSALVKTSLISGSSTVSQSNQPALFVIGGTSDLTNTYADGNGTPGKILTAHPYVYQANIDSNGAIQTWATDASNGQIPVASILHTSTVALNNQIYVFGGVNTVNAEIFAGAPSRSLTVFYDQTGKPADWHIGEASVFYENSSSGSTLGTISPTSLIPIRDPAWVGNTISPVYQPLIRAACASNNDNLYVLGGISRVNLGPQMAPTGSVAQYEARVWFCTPNPGGSIDPEPPTGYTPGVNGWQTTTPLPLPLYDLRVCVANNRLYVFGGRDSGGNPQSAVYYTSFNPDGTLGAWTATTPMMMPLGAVTLAEHAVVFASGKFYVLGGSKDVGGGNLQNSVFYCTPDPATGDISAWNSSITVLQNPVAGHSAVTCNGYIYVLGGRYTVPHSANAYMSNIAEIQCALFQATSWEGTFERYIDLDKDLFIDNLDWLGNANNETLQIKARFALEKGSWSDWTPYQATGPLSCQRVAQYVHYKLEMSTIDNGPPNDRTPAFKKMTLNFTGSKRVDEDCLTVNHNKFDPQVDHLMISFKTRTTDVSQVTLRVYNLEGELIRRQDIDLPPNAPLPYTGSWIWDGTNENSELVANGVYIIQFNSGDTHKIRKVVVFKK